MVIKMKLIIGGYAQGKLAFVCKENTENVYEIMEGTLPSKEWLTECREQGKTPVIYRFHEYVKKSLSEGKHPEENLQNVMEYMKDCIIISDEIGNGIVPMDASEREYRERTGRLLVAIAEQADEVIRVICGIGQKIK